MSFRAAASTGLSKLVLLEDRSPPSNHSLNDPYHKKLEILKSINSALESPSAHLNHPPASLARLRSVRLPVPYKVRVNSSEWDGQSRVVGRKYYFAVWATVQAPYFFSGRQRMNFAPCLNLPPVKWSYIQCFKGNYVVTGITIIWPSFNSHDSCIARSLTSNDIMVLRKVSRVGKSENRQTAERTNLRRYGDA
jgi:hypothetical protein